MTYSETLPPSGTMLAGSLYLARPWVARTFAGGSGLWRSPQAANSGQGPKSLHFYERCLRTNESQITLVDQVRHAGRLWPTPKASADKYGRPRVDDRGDLQARVRLWPTPCARDYRTPNQNGNMADQLPNQVGGSLNPDWVDLLMGYTPGYSAVLLSPPKAPHSIRGNRRARSNAASSIAETD